MPPETQEQAEARLLTVIGAAQFQMLDGAYVFEELPSGYAPTPSALACVRDGDVWAQLVPAPSGGSIEGAFKIFSFHFKEDLNASGFVAWLASHLKRTVGTGVIVICGRDRRGGAALYRASQGVFVLLGLSGTDRRSGDRRSAVADRARPGRAAVTGLPGMER